jgi:hypothetical protein
MIDDCRIPAGLPNLVGSQDVGRDRLDAFGPWLRGSAADCPHAPVLACQLGHEGTPGAAGSAEDNMVASCLCHDLIPLENCRSS